MHWFDSHVAIAAAPGLLRIVSEFFFMGSNRDSNYLPSTPYIPMLVSSVDPMDNTGAVHVI